MDAILDQQLIADALKGDERAFSDFVRRWLPFVFASCARYLVDHAEAEDATQETFVKVWKHLKRFDSSKDVRGWLGEIAKNTALDMLKKKRAIPFSSFENEEGINVLTETIPSSEPSPVVLVERSQLKAVLRKATAKLSPAFRQVLALYYEAGLNFREIAEKLGEPVHSIKSRHRRALIALRRLAGGGLAAFS